MLLYYKNNFFTQINNFNNFNHFAGLLNTILFNIDRKKEHLDINFAIIYIAEKTFYKNKDNPYNKIYLCSLLAKNKIYSEKKFWADLIDLKLNSVVEGKFAMEVKKKENEFLIQQKKLKKQMLKEEQEKKEEEENSKNYNDSSLRLSLPNEINQNNSLNFESTAPISNPTTPRKTSQGTNSLMNMFGNKVKNFFSNNNNNPNSESNKNLSHSLNLDSKRNNNNLDNFAAVYKEQILENLRKTEAGHIIREFLTHFCNFNVDVSEVNDLIVEYSLKYNYEQEKVCHFISILNSNMFTIKNKPSKISFIDFRKTGTEKNFKKYLNFQK